jgi:PAS domain S-box-containing protein
MAHSSHTDDTPAEQRANILLVDDQPTNLLVLRAVLEDLDQNLVTACSGEEALQRLLDQDFAVVLLDVQMSGLDGFETAKLIRGHERSRHTPIIFLTAHDDNGLSMEQAYSLGVVDYLVKPLIPVVLRSKVRAFIEFFKKTEEVKRHAERLRQVEQHQLEGRLAEEDARLRESEAHQAAILKTAVDCIILIDHEGSVIEFNLAAEQTFGYNRADAVGRDMADLIIPPRLRDAHRRGLAHYLATGEGPVLNKRIEMTAMRADGSEFPVELAIIRIRVEGPPVFTGQVRDITERKKAEELLGEGEERFRATFDQAAVGIAHVGLDGRWLRVNQKLCDIVGYRPDELLGMTFQDITHPDDLEADLAYVRRLLEGEIKTYSMEKRYFRKDHSLVWINLTVSLVRTPEGQPKYFISVVEDITQRKRADDAVQASEEQFRALVRASSDVVYRVSADWTEMRHLQGREFIADTHEPSRTWLEKYIHPDDQPHVMAVIREAVRTKSVFELEHRVLRVDGTLGWTFSRAIPLMDKGGEVVEWLGMVSDVTARKQAEEAARKRSEQVRRLAEVAAGINLATDVDSVCGVVAEEARHLIGAHQSVIGFTIDQKWAQAINTKSLSDKYARWRSYDAKLDGSGFYSEVCRTNRPMRMTQAELEAHPAYKGFGTEAGNPPPLRGWLAAPLVGRDGRNIGLIQLSDKYEGEFTADDEAVLVQLAQMASVAIENARLVESLWEGDRRKDEFLAMLAHELRNPLAPIKNALHVLRMFEDDRQAVEKARGMMERQVQHLSRIVDDLLEVSRVTRGKLTLRPERLDLARLVRVTAEDHRPACERAGLGLEMELPELPVWVQGDPTRLAQVLGNLLQNAVKFTDHGGKVAVRVVVGEAHQQAVLTVRDTGIGIEPHMLPRLFDAFAQADRSLDRSKGGLGLGLALVKGLVELHGGEVHAASAGPGQGSEFTVRLPAEPEPAALSKMPTCPRHDSKRLRILVVEDNQDSADSLRMLLELYGYEVMVAYSGPAGVKTAEAWKPDVVLCDIGLPGMDGYGVVGQLRRNPATATARMIAVTGYGSEDDRRRTQEAGFDQHMVKPVDPDALRQVLVEV